MKRFTLKKSHLFYLALVSFLVWKQGPLLMNNFSKEGQSIPSQEVRLIKEGESVNFPPSGRSLVIFWATWCGPCKIEMERLNKSVKNGSISSQNIYAVNPFESAEIVKSFLAKNPYHFTFIEAPKLAQDLNVAATPTTLFIEDKKVTSLNTGMSIIGIWKAEYFLD